MHRRLLLLRHAKAERAHPGQRDVERRLAERGRGDAPKLGAYMVRHKYIPQLAVVSPAARTRETWDLASAAMRPVPRVVFEERIYEATPQSLLTVVRETAPKIGTLLMVGHNPGFEELAAMLVATGDIETRQRLKEGFPTSALAVIEFALDGWNKVHPQSGRLVHFIEPRAIKATTD